MTGRMPGRRLAAPTTDADIRLLRVFRAVAEAGGLAAAEPRLAMGRSTISAHLAALEARMGGALCRRGRGGFALTERGQATLEAARRLFAALDEFRTQAAEGQVRLAGPLNLGFVEHSTRHPGFKLSAALSAFAERAPQVHVALEARSNTEIEAGVLEGRLHAGIVIHHRHLAGLHYRPLLWETQAPYCARGHALFDRPDRSITLDELHALPFVGRSYVDERDARRRYLGKRPAATAHSLEAVLTLVLTGRYIGIMPTDFAGAWVAQGAIRAIAPKLTAYRRRFDVVTRKGNPASPALAAFLEELHAAHPGAA